MNPPPEQQHPVSSLPQPRMPRMLMEARPAGPATDGYEVELKAWFRVLADSRGLIAGVALCVIVLAFAYALLDRPVYQANMMIQIEEDRPTGSANLLSATSSLFETKRTPVAEIELLHSRMLIAEAVDKLRLTIDVQPKYFPVIGAWIAARAGERLSAPGLFGHGGYAWSGEQATVAQFEVPPAWENRLFLLTATGTGRYRVAAGGLLAVGGRVGAPQAVETVAGRLELRVDSLAARPGAQFPLRKRSRPGTIETVQRATAVAEQGKQSGILEATLQGPTAEWVSSVLGEIGREYMRQNRQRKAADAEKSLLVHSKNNIIMLTGPTSGIGKSFVSANCAAVMAAGEKKVLLLDADFRNGCLHRHFGLGDDNDLYEYIAGQARADQIVRRSDWTKLDFIPAGVVPANAGEFLHRLDLGALLESLNARYDFVVIDLPSLLEVAGVLTIGGQADAIFLIARAGVTTAAEIGEALKRLYLDGIAPQGILFNDFKARATGSADQQGASGPAGSEPDFNIRTT